MARRIALSSRAGPVAVASAGGWQLAAQGAAYDLIMRGGHIVDGTGNPWFVGDVADQGGRIAPPSAICGTATATRGIDATGLVVAPGFIDMHTHSDNSCSTTARRRARSARA